MLQISLLVIYIIIAVLLLIFDIWAIIVFIKSGFFKESPAISSPKNTRKVIAVSLKDEIKKNSKILDLGSGYGSLVFEIGKAFPQNQIVGIEKFNLPFYFSKFKNRYKNVSFKRADFLLEDWNNFDIILTFLFTKTHEQLLEKYAKLKQNSIIVSNNFKIPFNTGFILYKTIDLKGWHIYFYQKT